MADTNVTETIEEMYADTVLSYRLYMIVGGAAIIINAIIIIVFWSSPVLRTKYQLLIALAMADLINGVAFVFAGAIKVRNLLSGLLFVTPMVLTWDCAMQPYPALLLIGAQWPACITLFLGMERFAAVHFPVWYKITVNAKTRFKVVVISVLFSLCSLGIGFAQEYIFFGKKQTFFLCTITGAFDKYYTTWNYIVTIFGHLIAFGLNTSAFLSAKSKSRLISSGMSATMRKEITLVRLMLGISLVSVLLISIPNVILWGQSWVWNVNENALGFLYVSFCSSSAINIFIYIFFNKEFRAQMLRFISFAAPSKTVAVVPAVEPITTLHIAANPQASFVHKKSSATSYSQFQPCHPGTVDLISVDE